MSDEIVKPMMIEIPDFVKTIEAYTPSREVESWPASEGKFRNGVETYEPRKS